MVTKNEVGRYLENCLKSLKPHVDIIHIVDDQSEDQTKQIAEQYGATVHVRPDHIPSFIEHEAQFRSYAWSKIPATTGDWILCLDADEFLTGPIRSVAKDFIKTFKVKEVFGFKDQKPVVRMDGQWSQITATRLAPWTQQTEFPNRPMGCGSLPTELAVAATELISEPQIIHMGYAREQDRNNKYDRYRNLTGHNPKHIASIVSEPTLRPLNLDDKILQNLPTR